MATENRTINSIKNILGSYMVQILTLILGFVNRSLFLYCLSADYLGLNSLFSSVISMLSLAELGVSSAITFHLYKPIRENDVEHIKALVNFYKACYTVIGLIIFLLGLCLIPILPNIVNFETEVDINLYVVYLLYLFNTSLSYWVYAYLGTVIAAHQKNYIIYKIRCIFKIINVVVCMIVLYISRNYYAYIFSQSALILIENICTRQKAYEMYPYLKDIKTNKLDKKEISNIRKDVSALLTAKISNVLSSGCDNIIVSTFVSTTMVGYISNYTMLQTNVISMVNSVAGATTAGIGNLVAEGKREKQIKIFKELDFINFYLLYFVCISLITLSSPFIELWLGEGYVIDYRIISCIVGNYFVLYSHNVMWVFKDAMGLFRYMKYIQLIQGIFNLLLSIVLCKFSGPKGVYLASFITNLVISYTLHTYYLFRYGFGESVVRQIIVMLFRLGFTAVVTTIINGVNLFFPEITIWTFLYRCIVTLLITNIFFWLVFHRTTEWSSMLQRGKNLIKSKKRFIR